MCPLFRLCWWILIYKVTVRYCILHCLIAKQAEWPQYFLNGDCSQCLITMCHCIGQYSYMGHSSLSSLWISAGQVGTGEEPEKNSAGFTKDDAQGWILAGFWALLSTFVKEKDALLFSGVYLLVWTGAFLPMKMPQQLMNNYYGYMRICWPWMKTSTHLEMKE